MVFFIVSAIMVTGRPALLKAFGGLLIIEWELLRKFCADGVASMVCWE
jgi:hypothetical protein